jgi:hypothetical protein
VQGASSVIESFVLGVLLHCDGGGFVFFLQQVHNVLEETIAHAETVACSRDVTNDDVYAG